MKPRILLDMDGVIANFYRGFASFLNERYGCTLDLDNEPAHYPFEEWGHGVDNIDFDAASMEWIQDSGFEKLPMFDGAKEFVDQLTDLGTIYIVTARIGDWDQRFSPDVKNLIKENTYNWLENHGMPTDNLYFYHDKVPFCQKYGISIMIEDKFSTALNASKNGIHTVLMNRGYNGSQIDRFRIYRVYSFDQAIDQVRKLSGK